MEKVCRDCRTVKSFDQFYSSKLSADKLTTYCKACYSKFRAFLLEYISRFDHPLTGQIKTFSLSEYAQKEPRL